MSLVAYALGGGLGHVMRMHAVLDALCVRERTVAVLVSSPLAADPRAAGELPIELAPTEFARDRAGLARWVSRRLAAHDPDVVLVDAFPAGILGELALVPELERAALVHVARLLRWSAYADRLVGPLPRFERCFAVEPLLPEHVTALGGEPEPLELAPVQGGDGDGLPHGAWVALHSGPSTETARLAWHAERARRREDPDAPLVVLHPGATPPGLPPNAAHSDIVPAAPLLADAARIVTAGGFNAIRETAPHRDRHIALPLPRSLDDQAERVRRLTAR